MHMQTRSTVNKVSREDYVRDLEQEISRLQGELQRARDDPAELQIQLMQMQALCEHYRASWAEALRASTEQEKSRQEDLHRRGLDRNSNAENVTTTPYMENLSEDPALQGC